MALMNILLNGQPFECDEAATLETLIDLQNLGGKRIAIEVNLEVIPRSQFADCELHDGDKVEIVHAIGGG
jgi:sulfur carrier protein